MSGAGHPRTKNGVIFRPGITGLAQVNNIDMYTPALLAKTDAKMINSMSMGHYFKFIMQTFWGLGIGLGN